MKFPTVSFRALTTTFLAFATVIASVAAGASPANAGDGSGVVFVLTNDSANAVAVFNRAGDGTLTAGNVVPTGGNGLAAGLGSQGALALSRDHKLLFAVNAGSNEITAFTIKSNTLNFAAKVPSNGVRPVSLTLHEDVLYVLNAGDANNPGNISGFNVSKRGEINPIAGSTQPLSSNAAGNTIGAAQVSFDKEGEQLIVTEKASNKIDLYRVDDGIAQAPQVFASQGNVPFGFAISSRNDLIVSEAASGSVSSYDISDNTLRVVTAASPTHQGAPCWVVVTKNGKYAYTTNAASGSITGFAVGRDGSLTPLNADGITAVTAPNASPVDMGLSKDSQHLYALTRDPVTTMRGLNAYKVNANGSLEPLPNLPAALPTFAASVAAY